MSTPTSHPLPVAQPLSRTASMQPRLHRVNNTSSPRSGLSPANPATNGVGSHAHTHLRHTSNGTNPRGGKHAAFATVSTPTGQFANSNGINGHAASSTPEDLLGIGLVKSLSQTSHAGQPRDLVRVLSKGLMPSTAGSEMTQHQTPHSAMSLMNTPKPASMRGTPGPDGVHSSMYDARNGAESQDRQRLARIGAKRRKAEAESIDNILTQSWGYTSSSNVERVAARLGLDSLWEDRDDGSKLLSIAGTNVLVEIGWQDQRVRDVALSFSPSDPAAESETLQQMLRSGAEILKHDLEAGYDDADSTDAELASLLSFARNLAILSRIDHIGKGEVSCFEALEGVYTSLKALHDFERQKQSQTEVLCRGYGQPVMNADKKLGLFQHYWSSRHAIASKNSGTQAQSRKRKADEMEGENGDAPSATQKPNVTLPRQDLYTLRLDVEALNGKRYDPIRTSTSWLSIMKPSALDSTKLDSAPDDKPNASEEQIVAWNDPPPPAIPPPIRFIAVLDPPLPLPLMTAAMLYSTRADPLNATDIDDPHDYLSLATELPQPTSTFTSSLSRFETFTRTIPVPSTQSHSPSAQNETLVLSIFTSPDAHGYLVEKIPFSHPFDILTILPVLRQWALVRDILCRTLHGVREREQILSTFAKRERDRANARVLRREKRHGRRGSATPSDTSNESDDDTDREEFTDSERMTREEDRARECHVDVTLSIDRLPRCEFHVVFALPKPALDGAAEDGNDDDDGEEEMLEIAFEVLPGGVLDVVSFTAPERLILADSGAELDLDQQDVDGHEHRDRDNADKKRKTLATWLADLKRVLERSEDVGIMVAWLRREIGVGV